MVHSDIKVAVVLLNYNTFKDTRDCIDSLQKCTYPNFEIWLVDNASKDDSFEKLQALYYESVIFVSSKKNLGFAGGCNLGTYKALDAGADYILLLNNDTVVDPDFLNHLVDLAETKPNAGLVGGKIYLYDEKNIFWDAGGYISLRAGNGIRRGHGSEDNGQFNQEEKVEFVTGCMMLIKKEVIEEVGGLPETYFFGVEEWDYGCRVRRAGYDLWYAPKTKIWHKVGGSHSDLDPIYYYNFIRNRIQFVKRNSSILNYILWYFQFSLYSKYIKLNRYKKILKNSEDLKFVTFKAFEDSKEKLNVEKGDLDNLRIDLQIFKHN
jgi:hypothetical protein